MRRRARLLLATCMLSVTLTVPGGAALAGPPVMMADGADGASRLERLMILLAMGNLQRRPNRPVDDEPGRLVVGALDSGPERLMGLAVIEPTARVPAIEPDNGERLP